MKIFNFDDKEKVILQRTKESTAFELVCAAVVAVMLIDVAVHWKTIGEWRELLVVIVCSLVCIALTLGLAYRPSELNWPQRLTRLSQYVVVAQSSRVVAVEFSFMFAFISFGLVHGGRAYAASRAIETVFVAVLFVTIGIYMWKVRKA